MLKKNTSLDPEEEVKEITKEIIRRNSKRKEPTEFEIQPDPDAAPTLQMF
jgi:hypothetical protein